MNVDLFKAMDKARGAVQLRRSVTNWMEVTRELMRDDETTEILTKLRDGTKVISPATRLSYWPIIETLMYDVYHIADLPDIEVGQNPVHVLDIGAHIGSASIALHRRFKSASFVCIEPNPITFGLLQRNLYLNQIDARAENVAASDQSGEIALAIDGTMSPRASTTTKMRRSVTRRVEARGIHELLDNETPTQILKVDCEGAEYQIFEALADSELLDVRVVLLEYHPNGDFNSLRQKIQRAGLVLAWHDPCPVIPGLGNAGFLRT